MLTSYLSVNTGAEMLCLLIALFCLFKDKEPAWKMFIFFLMVTCLVEVAGIYVRKTLDQPNFAIYNLFLIIECSVQNLFFYYIIKQHSTLKLIMVVWLVTFLLVYFTELIVTHFKAYASTSSTLMSVELILASVYYYYLLLKDNAYQNLFIYPSFWWVNGIICFYFGGIACNVFFSYMVLDQTVGISHSVRYVVFNVLNVILYSCWSYSFICRYRQRNLSS